MEHAANQLDLTRQRRFVQKLSTYNAEYCTVLIQLLAALLCKSVSSTILYKSTSEFRISLIFPRAYRHAPSPPPSQNSLLTFSTNTTSFLSRFRTRGCRTEVSAAHPLSPLWPEAGWMILQTLLLSPLPERQKERIKRHADGPHGASDHVSKIGRGLSWQCTVITAEK